MTWCIDFGTSFTSVAVAAPGVDAKTAAVEPESSHPSRLASVVLIEADGAAEVGLTAWNRSQSFPERYVSRPKSELGRGFGDDQDGVCAIVVDGRPRYLPAPEVCGLVLRHVYDRAALIYEEPDRLVLTHPASWDQTRTAALRRAAQEAGLPAPTLLPEPVAAARALAAEHAESLPPDTFYLVYDLGGGTCDLALVRREESGPDEVIGWGGVDRVGGDAFDHRLLRRVHAEVAAVDPQAAAYLCSPAPRTGSADWNHSRLDLFEQVTFARERLSNRPTATLDIRWPTGGIEVVLSRAELAAAIKDLIEDTLTACDGVLAEAGIRTEELGAVLLTGGASRTPAVVEALTAWAGTPPIEAGDLADEAVALGGAMPESEEEPASPARPEPRPVSWGFSGQIKVPRGPVYALVAPSGKNAIAGVAAPHLVHLDLSTGGFTPGGQVGDGAGYKMDMTWPRSLTLSPDGTIVASGTDDRGTVEQWKRKGRLVGTLAPGYNVFLGRTCTSVAVDDDCDTYVVRGNWLERWLAKERRWRRTVMAGTTVLICPGGNGIVVAGPQGVQRCNWDGDPRDTISTDRTYAAAGSAGVLYAAHRSTITLAAGGSSANATVIAIPSGTAQPTAMAAARNGSEFAVGTVDGSVLVWSGPDAEPAELAYSAPVSALAFTPGGGKVVVGHADGAVRWWIRI